MRGVWMRERVGEMASEEGKKRMEACSTLCVVSMLLFVRLPHTARQDCRQFMVEDDVAASIKRRTDPSSVVCLRHIILLQSLQSQGNVWAIAQLRRVGGKSAVWHEK